MPRYEKMALRIAPTAKIAGNPVARGMMRFQFDPETIEETIAYKWNYGEQINDNFPDPEPTGREPRVITFSLILLERGIGTHPIPNADMEFLTNAKKAFEESERIRTAFANRRQEFQDAHKVRRNTRTRQVSFSDQGDEAADIRKRAKVAGGVQQLMHVFSNENAEPILQRKIAEVSPYKTMPSAASGVDLQIKWLASAMRSHRIFQDQPPRLQLVWKRGDLFTCVLLNAKITHKSMHPETKATTHAIVKISLKEARDNFRPELTGERSIFGVSEAT